MGLCRNRYRGSPFSLQSQIRILNTAGEVLAVSGIPDLESDGGGAGASGLQNTYFESAGVQIGKGPIVIYSRNAQLPQVLPFNKEIPYSGPVPQEDMMLSVSASPYGYGFVAKTEFDPARRSSQSVSVLLLASDGQKLACLNFPMVPPMVRMSIDSVINAWLLASIFAVAIAILQAGS